MSDHPTAASQAESTSFIPSPVPDLGEGEPPEAMRERYGMEALPAEGPSDEADGELVDPDEAEAESRRVASGQGEEL